MIEWYIDHINKFWIMNTTIDRIDNNGNYSKENCRRATYQKQANNTRSNRIIEYNWKKDTLANVCRKYNCNYSLVHRRLSKWYTIKQAIEKDFLD